MNPIESLRKLVGSFSKEGVLPVSLTTNTNRTYLKEEELPEVAEQAALYNSGYIVDKQGFNLSLVPYKQKFNV